MLNPTSLANAFAAATASLYVIIFTLKIIAPPFYKLILNSQLYGADLASQVPRLGFASFLGLLIAVSISAWVFGYLVGVFYNRAQQKKGD